MKRIVMAITGLVVSGLVAVTPAQAQPAKEAEAEAQAIDQAWDHVDDGAPADDVVPGAAAAATEPDR
ncbi:MAG: hypothetical protein H7138_08980, partial [Myxococcales bacterium]|nr:hypothetical protein [Myxococcales bacterium]